MVLRDVLINRPWKKEEGSGQEPNYNVFPAFFHTLGLYILEYFSILVKLLVQITTYVHFPKRSRILWIILGVLELEHSRIMLGFKIKRSKIKYFK